MAARRPAISVVLVSYNSRDDLAISLASLQRQTVPVEVIVVDNGSSDGTAAFVRGEFPHVVLIEAATNLGYAGGNNRGFTHANGELIAVLNPDTEVEPEWAEALANAFDEPGVGMATSRICHFERRDLINACGNGVHISGLGFCRGYDEPRRFYEHPAEVAAVSGCAFMVRRRVLQEIDGFDDDFFLYVEDTDLSMRARLAGYSIRYVPDSIVYHRYALRPTPAKLYYIERNRLQMLLKTYRWRTLVALAPSIALTSSLTWLYAFSRGPAYVRSKIDADVWLVRNRRSLLRRRRAVQSRRRVDDTELLRLCDVRLPLEQIVGPARPAALDLLAEAAYRLAAVPLRLVGAHR